MHDVRRCSADSPSRLSWAHGDYSVRIVKFKRDPGSVLELDPVADGAGGNLYVISGKRVDMDDMPAENKGRVKFLKNKMKRITNGPETSALWALESEPIN